MKQGLAIIFTACLLWSCGGGGSKNRIRIDGSSTVYPITEAVAEEYRSESDARITVGFSGTGGGFKKFIRGETDINDASRKISPTEKKKCKKNGIEYLRLSVAYDGIAVLTHPENDWVDTITVEELKTVWEPEAQETIKKWSQIRDGWPDREFNLYGPGTASGTYDYFTEAIVGKSGKSRGDYTASEDDDVLIQGISTDKDALGFVGLAYYEENADKLQLTPLDAGEGGVKPTLETVKKGTYKPLSRALYIYVRKSSAQKKPVQEFVHFYLNNAAELSKDAGYVPLKEQEYEEELSRFNEFAGIAKGQS